MPDIGGVAHVSAAASEIDESFGRVDLVTRIARGAAFLLRPKYTAGALVCVTRPLRAAPDDPATVELLLVRQRARQRDRWGFPGGFARRRECFHVAAGRELREESGLAHAVSAADLVEAYKQPWARHIDHLFHVRTAGEPGPTRSLEICEVAWHRADALPALTRETVLAIDRLRRGGLLS